LLGWIDYFTHRNNGELDWYREDLALQEPGYSTQLIADEAVRVIEAQQAGKPLFLYVAFNALHAPYQVPERYKYRYEKMKEPRRTYAGMLAAMDEAVGQIVAALERTKRRKNALFVFFSDNGGPEPGRLTDNGPWRGGKGTLYEGGVRVIATASWPGKIPAGSTVRSIIHVTDLFPTILRLAGASLDQRLPLDGVDVWPVLSQGKLSRRREVLLNTTPFSGALRIDDWKLVLNGDKFATSSDPAVELGVSMQEQGNAALAETVELFDLAADPYENSNIAAKQPDKLRELRQRYDLLAAQAAKPLNL
jgi:arylsulfatase A-like enzyme